LARSCARVSGLSSANFIPCEGFEVIVGWSASNKDEDDFDNEADWDASAANEEVESWNLVYRLAMPAAKKFS